MSLETEAFERAASLGADASQSTAENGLLARESPLQKTASLGPDRGVDRSKRPLDVAKR